MLAFPMRSSLLVHLTWVTLAATAAMAGSVSTADDAASELHATLEDADIQPRIYDSDTADMLPAPAPVSPEEPSPAVPAAPAQKASKQKRKKVFQKQERWGFDGLRYVGKYGFFRFKLGGRLALDAGASAQDSALERIEPDFDGSDANVRTAQLQVSGNAGRHMFFKVQLEGSDAAGAGLKDAFVVFQKVPWISHLRIGMSKSPISLESSTSLKFNVFLERSLATALTPGRRFGIMACDTAFRERMTWAVGAFYRDASWRSL